jgi:hypothetical protein
MLAPAHSLEGAHMMDWLVLASERAADNPARDGCSGTTRLAKQARALVHELNNDFTIVISSLELLHLSADLPQEAEQLLTAACEQMAHAAERVDAFQRTARAYAPDA